MSCVSCKKHNKYSSSSDEEGDASETTFYDYDESKIVYQSSLVPLLAEGDSLTFSGYINANCERFSINFIDSNDDIALHINPRLPQNYIVRNSRLRNTWGKEEVSSPLPFSLHRGAPFTIQVLVTEGCYMISVNGHHFAEYSHRLDKRHVTAIEVKGDVEHVKMERADVTSYPERLEHSKPKSIFLDIFSGESPSADVTDHRKVMPKRWRLIYLSGMGRSLDKSETGLDLPYYGSMPARILSPGRCVRIVGRVKLLPHSFYINLQQGSNIWPHPTIAFHFNPRFSKHGGTIGQAIVCRNAWFNGRWGEEQRSELNTNFLPGKTFVMVVDCNTSAFDVYVNGKLITSFAYQVDPAVVDTVYVQGDIKLWNVVVERSDKHRANLFENPNYHEDEH